MKNKLLLLVFSMIFYLPLLGQINHTQELINLLLEGRCFEAIDFKKQYKDSIPDDHFFNLFYGYHMANFFNKPDSATLYLDEMLRQEYEPMWGPDVGGMRGTLLRLYDDMQQYDKAIAVCDSVADYYGRNPFGLPDDFIENEMKTLWSIQSALSEKAKTMPRINVVREEIPNKIELANDSSLIFFDAEYNGTTLKTIFDTGLTFHTLIRKEFANKIGVRIYNTKQDSTIILNGKKMKMLLGTIDTIRIGSVGLYNIPVVISLEDIITDFPDSLKQRPNISERVERGVYDMEVVMGLPLMKLIGRFEFDWNDNTMYIPPCKYNIGKGNISPNIYIMNNNLYTRTNVNGLNLTGIVDTGDTQSFIDITFPFYEKNRDIFQFDYSTEKEALHHLYFSHIYTDIKYEIVKDAVIRFDGKEIISKNKHILIYNFPQDFVNIFDGTMGNSFFRKVGLKTILDFNIMRLEGE